MSGKGKETLCTKEDFVCVHTELYIDYYNLSFCSVFLLQKLIKKFQRIDVKKWLFTEQVEVDKKMEAEVCVCKSETGVYEDGGGVRGCVVYS